MNCYKTLSELLIITKCVEIHIYLNLDIDIMVDVDSVKTMLVADSKIKRSWDCRIFRHKDQVTSQEVLLTAGLG